ncbi:MAG: TIGR00282 family metallophosphoesterase [Armatimonadota bacterium]
MLRILFVGDVMGNPGRRALSKLLGALCSRLDVHFVVANGENAAGGLGITKTTAAAILDAGVDVITLGNHAFSQKNIFACIESEPRIIRPANYPPGVPGRGWGVFETRTGEHIAVANLAGRTFMAPLDCPFRTADSILAEIGGRPRTLLVDMHAEATSEKAALGWYLDGRASAVVGTHTHVQTSDERVLPGGTAYITDVGMTGVLDSVLGLDKDQVIERFLTQVTGKFKPADGRVTLQGVVVEIDPETGRAKSIQRANIAEDES